MVMVAKYKVKHITILSKSTKEPQLLQQQQWKSNKNRESKNGRIYTKMKQRKLRAITLQGAREKCPILLSNIN